MKKNDIMTDAFSKRLADVYGNDGVEFQRKRFTELAQSFEKDFGENADLRFFSRAGQNGGGR